MKLRSTLLFAAASFTASALAPVAFPPVVYGAGESISINFDSESGAMGGNWNDTTGASGTVNGLKDSTGTTLDDLTLIYSSKNTWGFATGISDEFNVLKGYLDDGGSGVSIEVSNISYLLYDVTVIMATDQAAGGQFTAVTFNGRSYTNDGNGVGVLGTDDWGVVRQTEINEKNSFTVSGLSGTLTMHSIGKYSGGYSTGQRGCIAGIQIVNTYTGTATSVDLGGTEMAWTNSLIGSTAWTNSTEDAGTYAAFNLTADTTVSVSEEGITTDAITASGSGALTLSGNAITLIGPGVVRTDSDTASIVVNNNLTFSNGGTISGNVTLSGDVFVVRGSLLGSISAFKTDSVVLSENATLNLGYVGGAKNDLTFVEGSGVVAFQGNPPSGDHSSGIKLDEGFTGTVRVSGNANLPANSELGGATKIILDNAYLWTNVKATFAQDVEVFGTTTNYGGVGVNKQRGGNACNITYTGTFTLTENSSFAFEQGTTAFDGEFIGKNGSTLWSGATLTFNEKATLQTLNVKGGTTTFIGGNDSSVSTINLGGTVVFSKNTSETNSTYNVGGIFATESAYGGSLTIDSGATVNAKTLSSNWGMGALTINGVLNLSETLRLSSASADMITGSGTINTEQLNLRNAGKYQLSGGITINLGAGGILQDHQNGWNIRIGDATLGATAAWKTVGVDNGRLLLNSTENGGVKFDTTGGNIEITTTLSDNVNGGTTEKGALSKLGTGTLILSGANSYSGGTTIKAGTLVAANASSLGSGDVIIEAGTLLREVADTLTVGGNLTVSAGAVLDLGELSAEKSAISVGGDVSLMEGVIFNIASQTAGTLLSSTGALSGITEEQVKAALYIDGVLVNQRAASATISENKIAVTFSEASVLDLTWNGGEDGVWKSNGSGWKNGDTDETFQSGDSVTFGADATIKTVSLVENLSVGGININDDYTFDFSKGLTISSEKLEIAENETLTLTGAGTLSTTNIPATGTLSIGEDVVFDLSQPVSGLNASNITGSGTIAVSMPSTISATEKECEINLSDAFTGTTFIKSGRFYLNKISSGQTIYTAKFGETLKLGDGVVLYLSLNSPEVSFSKNLVIEGTVEMFQNNGSLKFTKESSVTGSGTYKRTSPGTLTFEGAVDLGGFNTNNGTTIFKGKTAIGSLTVDTKASVELENATVTLGSISGNLTIGSNSTATVSGTDTLGYEKSNVITIGTGGTLDLGNKRWTIGSANQFILNGGTIVGVGDGNGALDFYNENDSSKSSTIQATADSSVEANIRLRVGSVNFDVSDSVNLDISGGINGGGRLVKLNQGTLTLSGSNSYTGGTTISAGKIIAKNASSFGSGEVSNESELEFDFATRGEVLNVISGTGSLVKAGEGELILSGTNTYTGKTSVSAGTLSATKAEVLGSGALEVGKDGTLELAFGGTFSREVVGIESEIGTIAKSGAEELTYSGVFAGSFNAKSGILSVDVENGSYKNLSIASGATFKAKKDLVFETVSNTTGTLSGETESTRVSVASGAFAGTLSNVSLVKTGAGTLDLNGATFAKGGSVVIEDGKVSNLKLADSGTLYLAATESSDITLSSLTISGAGTIRIGHLWDTDVQATIADSFVVESGAKLTLFIEQLTLGSSQAVFTFTSDTKSAWEAAFGTLTTDGKFTGGTGTLTLAGLGTYDSGVFSWNGDTLYFKENREAKDFVWTKTDYYGKWSGDNWNNPKEAFQSGMNAIFNENSVSAEFDQQGYEKGAYVIVDEDVFAAKITINAGADACVSISEEGGKLSAAKGISVESGALYFYAASSDFYTGEFKVAEAGTVILAQPTLTGVEPLNLRASFSGTGTIQYGIENSKITLSGDRSQFTGTLDVNAGTVVLANGTGTEKFSSIDIAEGATVAANGGAAVDGFSTLSLGQVSGTGTLSVSAPQGAKFFALDLSGSGFTGAVELNAVDMVFATNPSEAMVTSVSNLANASSVRLTNGASLNFFNEASTFDKNIEVADTNGSIRVYGNNTGTTLSGDISGAGTLTVKDGGKLILSGAVGTAESALGGLTLSAGSLEISGGNSSINVSGDVVLSGVALQNGQPLPNDADIPTATINTTGNIDGNVVLGGTGIVTKLILGGDLTVGGDLTLKATSRAGRATKVLSGAEISISGTTTFEDNESLIIENGAIFSSETVSSSQWGFNATLGAGATLSAGTLTFGKDTDSVSGAAEGDASRLEIGTEDGTGTLSGTVVVKDVTIGVREGATAWSSDANVKLNGGATTFDVGDGQEITLNGTITEAVETDQGSEGEEGYVAATSSALIKNGAGTLTLGKANANKGGTTLNAGTLKFTSKDGVTLSGSYTFAGGMLAAGEGTTLTLGAGTAFSGAVVYTNDKNGKLLVSEDLSITGEGNSLTLHEKANVEIASGKTLSLGALNFTGNGSKIEGEGTLSLAGTVAVDNNRTNTITSGLALSENTVLAISKGTLEIESEDISTGGKTLTKSGAGTLTLDTDAVYDFDGSFSLQGGTVNVGSRELTINDTHSFELANGATLEGDLVLEKGSSATLGAGKITGDVALSGATLEFSGATSVGGKLSWTDSNTITLDAEFRKTITSTPYTLISFDSKEGDNANLTFTDVEIYGRRSFTLDIGEKKIDLLATGTLVWNANVATWTTNATEEADWTLEQTSGNTTSAFLANDYVEFRDSRSIVIADDTIQTSGVVFNIANNGSFRLNAPTPATGEDGRPTEEQKIVTLTDAVYDNDNTTGKSAGLTVVAGNVTIGNYIVNDLSSVTISSGSLTVFNVDALGIVDKTDSANEKIATLTIGGGVNDDGTPKSATLNISLPGDDGKTEDVNESVGIVDQKVAIVNAGIISVVNANTTVEVSGAISGANAKLTKTGWGALKIKRDSTLGMLAVDSGRLELVGNADAALSIKSVQIGNQGEMFLVGDTDGANTRLDALTVNSKLTVTDDNTETPGLGAYRTGTLQGSGNISGNLYVGANTSFDITTSNTDGSSTTTNYKGTAVSGNLTLTGSIASYGTEDAALYKKGTGTLTLVSAEKENDVPKAFTLDASVIHEAGTLAFTHGGVISKNYTIAENATAKLSFNGVNASELSAGITLGSGSNTTIENSGNGTLKINGVSSSGTTKTTLAGTNITLSGDTVDFGKLTKIDDTGVLSALYVNANNVEVDATTFSAGYVAFGNGASLTISKDTTATANALYVGEGVSSTLDLTDGDGAKFSVGTDEKISVFGGTGTLNVKGGTLELKGATYGDEDAPSIVLDKATLAFNVTGAEDPVGAYLDGVSTADGSTGTIEKTGAGMLMVMEGLVELVFGGEVQDLSFDGKISVTEGNMMLFATASQAEVEITSDTALEFAGSAELADSVDSVNTFAESLSGAGTLNVSGELYVNDKDSAFNGTIKASGGTLYVSGATSDWMANGTDRVLFIESGTPLVGTGTAAGKIATYDGSATLTAVSLSGHGIFLGAAEDKALTVEEVSATAGSDLTLQGYGTLGAMKFAEANTDNTIVIGSGANWTIDGESENLEKLSVSGLVTVAHTGALGSAKVLSSGKIIFDAEGTYANLFNLDKGAVIEAKKNTSLTGSFWHTDGSNPAVTFVAGENAKLTLSDSFIDWTTPTFETKDATATIAVDVTSSVKILNSGSKLSGAGTFEKLGDKKLLITADAGTIGAVAVTAGTLEFEANAKLSVAEGGAGTLSVADGATLKIAGTKLGDWTLTGEGSAEVSGTASLGAISSAKDVALSGQLSVSGNISDSSLKFADENTKLTTTGTAAQSVTGTLSGATVTLVNENKAGVTYDAALANDVKTLVLTAASGVNGAVMNAAYAGSLTKTLDGEWTVSDYTFGKTADQKLTVSGGTLIWKGVKLEANAGAISLEKSATLKINGLASGDTLSAEIDGNGTLEIAGTGTEATPLKLDTTAASDSKWMLHVSGGSQVQTSKNLPGALWIEGEGSVLDLNYASDQTVENSRYLVSSGAKLKLSGTGTLTLKDSGDSTNPHTVSGTVEISAGKLLQSGNVAWDPYGTVEIGTNGELAVNVGGSVNNNNATLKGDGKLTIEKTAASGYRFGGEISGFAGTVDIQSDATVKLAKQLFDNAEVKVDGTLNLELSGTPVNDQGEIVPRNLKNISGAGTLVIAAPDDFYTRYGIYDYDTTTNTFAGTLKVESGVLSVEADKAASLAATKVEVGGTSPAEYYEGMWQGASWVGITTGGFLQLKDGNNYDVTSLYDNAKFNFGDKAGTIYSGGTFRAAKDFGVGKNNLFVLDNATLTLTNGASVDGGVFVKSDGSLVVDYTATPGSAALRALSASSENSGLTGNLTLNGVLKILVTDDAVNNGALLDVGGKVYLSTDGGNASKIELEVTGTENLDNKRVVVLGGEYGGNVDPNTVVEVTDSAGNRYKVTRDVNGQIVILNAATEYSDVPSGLSGLASVLREANSPLWDYVQGDLAKSDERLVGLSPVSFGSLVEMQSGFAALENDLLRERLEQRRYERAFISDKKNTFKPFVNIVGSEREGDGNGTESANYDISHTGILGGFDVAVSNNTVFGVSLGFDFAKADLHGGAGKHEGNSTRFGVYGMSVFENTYFGYGLSAGATSFETKRNSGYNGETLSGSTDGNDINASLLFGAGWTLDKERGIDLAPYVGLDFGYAYADGFKEEGGRQTALDVDKTERLSLRGKLGATLSWRATGSLRFSLDAAFAHEFLDSDIDVDAAFASGDLRGKSFSSTAYLMDENTIQIGPRFDYRVDETWSVSGGYSYETDLDDTATHSANLGVRARF